VSAGPAERGHDSRRVGGVEGSQRGILFVGTAGGVRHDVVEHRPRVVTRNELPTLRVEQVARMERHADLDAVAVGDERPGLVVGDRNDRAVGHRQELVLAGDFGFHGRQRLFHPLGGEDGQLKPVLVVAVADDVVHQGRAAFDDGDPRQLGEHGVLLALVDDEDDGRDDGDGDEAEKGGDHPVAHAVAAFAALVDAIAVDLIAVGHGRVAHGQIPLSRVYGDGQRAARFDPVSW
jgi:hypothetical protein